MSVYLHLFHGRKSLDEQLNDWGTDGPLLGPFEFIQITYANTIRCGTGDDEWWLAFDGDCVKYKDVFYGDIDIVSEPGGRVPATPEAPSGP